MKWCWHGRVEGWVSFLFDLYFLDCSSLWTQTNFMFFICRKGVRERERACKLSYFICYFFNEFY